MKHESKKVKETTEEVARREKRERARLRRIRRTAESDDPGAKAILRSLTKKTADEKKGPSVAIKLKKIKYSARNEGVSGRSDPSPPERKSAVPVRQETGAGRMKTVISQDNILMMMVDADPDEVKIQFCNDHYDALVEKLKIHGIDHLITTDLKSLRARLNAKGIDPLWSSQEALIRLAINTVGSEGVVQHRCPVCALSKFDFVAQIALVMKQACVKRMS